MAEQGERESLEEARYSVIQPRQSDWFPPDGASSLPTYSEAYPHYNNATH